MSSSSDDIPFHRIVMGAEEKAAIGRVLDRGWLTSGPEVRGFEEEFGAVLGASHSVAVASGTAALELALMAADIGAGDAVVTTPYSFAATAEVIVRRGAIPIFAEVEPATLNLDPASVSRALVEAQRGGLRVRALLPVHLGGVAVDLTALDAIACEYDLVIIEDAAHAFPTRHGGHWIGGPRPSSRTVATCFSFYANKTLTTGEGGMVTTEDANVAKRVRRLALHGLDRDAWQRRPEVSDAPEVSRPSRSWEYDVVEVGTKANLGDLAAAIGRVRLARWRSDWEARARVAAQYDAGFRSVEGVETPPSGGEGCEGSWHLYPVRLAQRDAVSDALAERGIGTSVHYRILTELTAYAEVECPAGPPTVAHRASQRVLSLPIYPELTDAEIHRVIEAVADAVAAR